jgi:hypothetical protein
MVKLVRVFEIMQNAALIPSAVGGEGAQSLGSVDVLKQTTGMADLYYASHYKKGT